MRIVLFNNTATVDDGSTVYNAGSEVPEGQIAIFDADAGGNTDLTGANCPSKFYVVQGVPNGSTPLQAGPFEKAKVEKVNTGVYSAPQKQITVVGFDGVDGEIDSGAGDYLLKIVDLTNGYEPYPTMNVNYYTETADGQYTIAKELAKAALANKRLIADFQVLVNEATTQLVDDNTTPANVTLDVVRGSKFVEATVTAGADVNATVGDLLRIGDATDDAFPVYEIAAIETNPGAATQVTITLDRAYAGDTATGLAAGNTSTAPADSDPAGVKIVGVEPQPYNFQGESPDEKAAITSFSTALSTDFGTTDLQSIQAPEPGTGSYELVSKLEEEAQAAFGYLYRHTPFQPGKPKFYADDSLTYDVVTIQIRTNTTANIAKSNKYLELVFAYKAGELAGATADFATYFGV